MTGNDLLEVYRKLVLEHSKQPHNQGKPEAFDFRAQGFNPLCGDKITVYVNIDNDHITSLRFDGSGCAISIASASMMTVALQKASAEDARQSIEALNKLLKEGTPLTNERMSDLNALEGVRSYPSRIKCATLAWSTMDAALNNNDDLVSTE